MHFYQLNIQKRSLIKKKNGRGGSTSQKNYFSCYFFLIYFGFFGFGSDL